MVRTVDYASKIGYAAHGGIKALKLGRLYESWGYNARLQPTAIRLGTAASGTQRADKLSLSFDYGTTANNGNVLSQTIALLEGSAVTQRYRYDGANRLGLASEGGTAPTSDSCPTDAAWRRGYITIHTAGNRAVTGTRGHTLPAATPTATSAYSATTNRITAGSYDRADNLLSLAGVGALSYDGENRLTAYDNNVGSLQEEGTYAYDGLGQRVKRTTTIRGASETTVYVYDAFGRLAAEYSSVAPVAGSGGTFYRTEDHLGSTRLVTKQDQTVAECRDFFPFGERIGSGLNGRSADCYGGTSNAVKQQFTGKERDKESSLDYFGARYFSARLGRFTGVDPANAGADPLVPQSWNGYAYAINNPLAFIDPTGLSWIRSGDGSVTWTDECANDPNCFDTLAVANEKGITVYGSTNQEDVTLYAAKKGLVDAALLGGHSDSAFEVKPNLKERFVAADVGAAIFNVATEYSGKFPGSSALVLTNASTAEGESRAPSTSHTGGLRVDFRYPGLTGHWLQGNLASKNADEQRMKFLIEAFGHQNANLGSVLTGTPWRFDLPQYEKNARGEKLRKKHRDHFHLQRTYPWLLRK